MGNDLLEQFRGKPASANAVLDGPKRVIYEAFRKSDKRQFRLKLRPRLRAWERINYSYLHRILEDGVFGTQIGLVFSFAVVTIRGRNLQSVAEAIDAECCEFIQEFDRERWEMPSDPKAPFIERIDIHVQTKVEASDALLAEIAEAEKKRKQALSAYREPPSS